MSAPFPYDDPQSWQCTIGTWAIEHQVVKLEIFGLKTGVRLDKKEAAGASTATITYQGPKLGTFEIQITSWTPEGWAILMGVCRYCAELSGGPVAISHPMLSAAGITAAIVEEIIWPDSGMADLQVAKLSCTQWAPRPRAGKKSPVTKTGKIADLPSVFTPPGTARPQPQSRPTPPWLGTPKP